jgi:hypothetical protein
MKQVIVTLSVAKHSERVNVIVNEMNFGEDKLKSMYGGTLTAYRVTTYVEDEDLKKYKLRLNPNAPSPVAFAFSLWGHGGSLNGCGTTTLSSYTCAGFGLIDESQDKKGLYRLFDAAIIKTCKRGWLGNISQVLALSGVPKLFPGVQGPIQVTAYNLHKAFPEYWKAASIHDNAGHSYADEQILAARIISNKNGTIHLPDYVEESPKVIEEIKPQKTRRRKPKTNEEPIIKPGILFRAGAIDDNF